MSTKQDGMARKTDDIESIELLRIHGNEMQQPYCSTGA